MRFGEVTRSEALLPVARFQPRCISTPSTTYPRARSGPLSVRRLYGSYSCRSGVLPSPSVVPKITDKHVNPLSCANNSA